MDVAEVLGIRHRVYVFDIHFPDDLLILEQELPVKVLQALGVILSLEGTVLGSWRMVGILV